MAKPKLTNAHKDEVNKILIEHGYFYGLKRITEQYEVSPTQVARIKAALFTHLMVKIREAKKEIARLQVSVGRVEAACMAGTTQNPAEAAQIFTPTVNRLLEELRTFDGWVISLLESDISLLMTAENPQKGGIRVKGLKPGFAELWNLRIKGRKPFDNYADIFDMTVFVP